MIGPLVQMAVLVAITHGFRALGAWVSPRRSGLLMGLPSTTALALVGCGLEGGLVEASAAAEGCLVGLAAAAAMPLVYAWAAAAGWRAAGAAAAATAGYATVAAGLWWLPKPGAEGCIAVAAAGVAAACHLGSRIRPGRAAVRGRVRTLSDAGRFTCRTAVPAGYFLMIRSLRAVVGAGFAGRFITFPGGSLAVLVTTHLEDGPETARRMAAAMPTGGLVMLAFLSTFRYACPRLGLGGGTALGFATALLALAVLGTLTGVDPEDGMTADTAGTTRRPRFHQAQTVGRVPRLRAGRTRGFVRRAARPPRSRFSPRVETLAG